MSEQEEKKQAAPKTKTVKIKVLRPITDPNTNIVANAGDVIEVTEAQALELTRGMKNVGSFAFRGERYNVDGEVKRHSLQRAELVA